MTTNSLNQIPADQWYQTLVALQKEGVKSQGLKKIRSNSFLAARIAKLLAERERRTKYTYPPEYKPLSIAEQVKALQKISAFAGLDATWALNEAQAWYNELDLPDWVKGDKEGPVVYVKYHELGGFVTTQDLVLKAIAAKRNFHNYREGQFTVENFRQAERTSDMESDLSKLQPGGFLIVPSQAGDRWGGYPVEEVRESYDEDEFGLDGIAEGCRVISHPKRLVRFEELDPDCPGAEFNDPDADDRFDHAPYFRFNGGKVGFGSYWSGNAHAYYGSASGCLPQ